MTGTSYTNCTHCGEATTGKALSCDYCKSHYKALAHAKSFKPKSQIPNKKID